MKNHGETNGNKKNQKYSYAVERRFGGRKYGRPENESAKKNLRKTLVLLPALNRPTLANLSDRGWLSLEIILAEQTVKELIPALKRIGAEKIIEYPLNKIIY